MTPSHVRKRGVKYRYYLSSTLLQGQAQRSGSMRRVPATDIEALVTRSVRDHLKPSGPIDDHSLVADYVERVEIQQDRLIIQLAQIKKSGRHRAHKTPVTRHREMLLPTCGSRKFDPAGF
jgi:site-specific DNA recombinase